MENKKEESSGFSSGKGLSPFIASVLTILFGILMLALILGVVNPTIRRVKDSSIVSDAFQNLNLLNSVIKEVASESEGSKRTVPISVSGGEFSINTTTDSLIFTYDPAEDMRLTGRRGDTHIEHGSVFLDFFNWYVDGSKPEPAWTNASGNWTVSNYKYEGERGLAYHNLSTLENYRFSGTIYNSSGGTGGQIFLLPTNPERLVGFWTLDNRTGGKVYDWSSNGNNGTLKDMNTTGNSTSGWQDSASCKAGVSCLMFDGVNDYVDVGNDASLNPSTEITLEAWIYINTLKNGNIVWKWEDGGATRQYFISINSEGKIAFGVASDPMLLSVAGEVSAGNWYHVVGTYNGSNQYIYKNGQEIATQPKSGSIPSVNENCAIGADTRFNTKYFDGIIDEVKIWNVSLSAEEVAAEYELSLKKLTTSGSKSVDARTPNAAVVLSNPDGVTSFDDIKVSGVQKEQKLVIPYSKIDLNGTLRIAEGDHQVIIKHMGTNTTLGEPIIQITSS